MSTTHEKERTLTKQIGREVETALPGVEVLAVELQNPERFTVFVDSAEGVDHALCARVTDVLREYLREYAIDVSSPGIERPVARPALPQRDRPPGDAAHTGAQAAEGRDRRRR